MKCLRMIVNQDHWNGKKEDKMKRSKLQESVNDSNEDLQSLNWKFENRGFLFVVFVLVRRIERMRNEEKGEYAFQSHFEWHINNLTE